MPRYDEPKLLSTPEAFRQLTVDELKPLAALVGEAPKKKNDLVDFLAKFMANPKKVQALYAGLDDMGQKAVQEATHDPEGILHQQQFFAKYGHLPNFGGTGKRYRNAAKPTILRLFFLGCKELPVDLRELLLAFVPEPPPLTVDASDELPAQAKRPHVHLGEYSSGREEEKIELRVRHTARAALHDIKAMLRLVDAGEVKVGDKSRWPSQAAMKNVARVLLEGDFYGEEDQTDDDWDPASDLCVQAFAWPMLLQAAGLASAAGARLQLTAAGRKATAKPAHDAIRLVWEKWQKTTLLDEFNRIHVIKGQQAKGLGLTAVAPRRQAIIEVLQQCPVQKWIALDELFRVLKVLAPDFSVTRNAWRLYLTDQEYGSLGYDGDYTWEVLQGRFVLAFLFEYAATLGLLDVAYIAPEGARNDFRDRWGTGELSCLSRYDGLLFVRINSLGSWCLELAAEYQPEAVQTERVLQVLPNLDVVAADRPPSPADVLFLERFTERSSEAVWRLEKDRVLAAVEQGLAVGELKEFLAARSQGPLPQTVQVFLDDLEAKAGQIEDLGGARLLACKDPMVAQTLASDRRLRSLCQRAGERHLVFRAADEAAVRRALRDLGYVLPPGR